MPPFAPTAIHFLNCSVPALPRARVLHRTRHPLTCAKQLHEVDADLCLSYQHPINSKYTSGDIFSFPSDNKNLIFKCKFVFHGIYLRHMRWCFAGHMHNERITKAPVNHQPQQCIVILKSDLFADFQFAVLYWLHSSWCGYILMLLPPVRQVCAPWPASPVFTW